MAIQQTIAREVLEGTGGAAKIGIAAIPGITATQMQAALEATKALVDAKLASVQDEGVTLPFRNTLNFAGSGVSVVENTVESRYDVTIAGLGDEPRIERVQNNGIVLGDRKIINFLGDFTVEEDIPGDRYNVTAVIPDASDPATTAALGEVKLSVAPADAANPIAAGDNDTRLSNHRTPTDSSVTASKASTFITFVQIVTSTSRPAAPKQGLVIFETDSLKLLKQVSTDPTVPDWRPVGDIGDLPVADDGESNPTELVRSSDSRLSDLRAPVPESVTLDTAAPDISFIYICTSTTRPGPFPKRGQIIFELDTQNVLKQIADPATPDWEIMVPGDLSPLTFQDEGVTVTQRPTINVTGPGVTLTDDAGTSKTIVNVPGLKVQSGGSDVGTRATLNFAGLTVADDAGNSRVNVTSSAALDASDVQKGSTYLTDAPVSSASPRALSENAAVLADFITGLTPQWTTTGGSPGTRGTNMDHLAVSSGAAWIPSANKVVNVSATVRPPAGTFAAFTLYYLYLYLATGVPTLELVADAAGTRPVSYKGDAKIKGVDNTRRYLGAVITTSDATPRMLSFDWLPGDVMEYQEFVYRAVDSESAASATNETVAYAPFHIRKAWLRVTAYGGTLQTTSFGNPDMPGFAHTMNNDGTMLALVGVNSALQFKWQAPSPASCRIDVAGYHDPR